MRLKDMELGDTFGQTSYSRLMMAKLKGGDPKKSKAVVHEVSLVLLLGKLQDNVRKQVMDNVHNELRTLLTLNHPSVVQLGSAFVDKDCVYFVTESFEEGTLHKHLEMRLGKMVPEPVLEPNALDWFTQLSRGIQYLHNNGIIHGNINDKVRLQFYTTSMLNLANFSEYLSVRGKEKSHSCRLWL